MKRLGVLTVVLAFAACSAAPMPATHYYLLRAPGETPAVDRSAAAAEGLVGGVRTFAVDPPYDQDRLVYRVAPEAAEVGFYSYHRWAAPLGHLVSVAVADGLRETAGIALIEPAVAGVDYSASLAGRLLYIEHLDAPRGQQVRVALELVLRGDDGEVLWSDTLATANAIGAEGVGEVVGGLRQALDAVLGEASAGIASALE